MGVNIQRIQADLINIMLILLAKDILFINLYIRSHSILVKTNEMKNNK